MKIRARLTIRFALISSLILITSSALVYLFSSDYRRDDFYQRMINKGTNAAKLLLEVEEIDASMLRRIEKDNPSNLPREKIRIYNYQNTLLYSSDTEDEFVPDKAFLDKIRLEEKVRFRTSNDEAVGFLFKDQYDRFVVIVAARDIYGMSKLRNLLHVLLVVCSIGIVLVIVGGWIFSSQAVRPIQQVISEVNEIGISNLHVRVNEGNGKDEIAQLAATFNNMLDRLEEAFKIQKNFIANASHELRTPLTIISGEIEVLLRKDRDREEYIEALKSVYDEIYILSRVSNQLLLLAQTSSEREDQAVQEVRCDELIWQVKSEVMKAIPEATIDVRMSTDENEAFNYAVKGNPHLIKTVFTNLVENACKYAPDHKVEIDIRSDEYTLFIRMKNRQSGLTEENLRLLFEPFYRGNNSPGKRGNGLGLSLVKNIMERHDGYIKLQLEGDYLLVDVEFPVIHF
ncbi:MAG: HAMP domain-containing protein [Bacteroidetes bacterium]|nr:HAMP domain-containing protein [Bacteroidota bacterium]